MFMNQYLIVINLTHHRTGAPIGKTVCFVEADTEEDAKYIAWQQHGSESSSVHCVLKVKEDNNSFTVYN